MKELHELKKITILSGAGLSQESGIKTFRDANGLWENHPIEEVASPGGYQKNPELVQNFYNLRRRQLKEVQANAAHLAIADLEKLEQKDVLIITQNVDDLHERAGSKNIIHMHGELRKIRNTKTNEIKYWEEDILEKDYLSWRPDIVWFGEEIKGAQRIYQHLVDTELFIAIGTSSQVYPAAQFFQIVKENHGLCVELNLEPTQMSSYYDLSIQGKASEVVPSFLKKLYADEL
tara:strand:- start:119700 stop:120398 length:699 start_codon:yes stop_codon:yes gene_type:complete